MLAYRYSRRGALFASALLLAVPVSGSELKLHGQASGWLGAGRDVSYFEQTGLRYIPTLSLSLPFRLDAEASVNAYESAVNRDWDFDGFNFTTTVKPYRLWLRYSTSRLEARAGLQKINFGSATLLRPLQWFDRVDPRDPLGLTDGVYGLLARYYFQDNSNIWAWGLLGNSSPKGWEQFGTERWAPEPGARVQIPIPRGEVAGTYDHRTFDYTGVVIPEMLDEQAEDRFGFDAKVDLGVGFCLEGMLSRQTRRLVEGEDSPIWSRAAVVGVDYTVGLGSGIGAAAEHLFAGSANEPFGRGTDAQFSALMISYPIDLLDNLRGIVFFDWVGHRPYSYVAWQRTLDNWVFSVAAFWYPDRPAVIPGQAAGGAAGKGLQVTVVFNH
ncbi:MAG TPA: hypothetical protein VMH22_07865 [bacterium]|nr:hypothetical protein [bacterium]